MGKGAATPLALGSLSFAFFERKGEMRDYKQEYENRVAFIRQLLADSGAKGIVFGNSGGKDSALVGILCKAACDNTVGIIMP